MEREALRLFYVGLLGLTSFLLPFNVPWMGLLAAALVAFWVLGLISGSLHLKLTSVILCISILYLIFLMVMYGNVYADRRGLLRVLETRAGLWLGIFFLCGTALTYGEYRSLWKAFSIGLDLSLMICLVRAVFRAMATRNPEKLIHSDFSFFIHAGYLSAMVCVALMTECLRNSPQYGRLLLYGISLLLLSSKALWMAAFPGITTALIMAGKQGKSLRWPGKLRLPAAFILLLGMFFVMPRIVEAWHELRGQWPEKVHRSSVLIRREVWHCGLEMASSVSKAGMGETRLRHELERCYLSNGIDVALKNRYNLHNQFLEEYLLHGMGGLLLLILLLMSLLWKTFQSNRLLVPLMAAVLLFWGGTESFLQRSMGCLWMGFVWPLSTTLYEKE